MALTLNQRSYLVKCIAHLIDMSGDDLWDLSEYVTEAQRGKILAHFYRHDYNEVRDMIDNINAFQRPRKDLHVSNEKSVV